MYRKLWIREAETQFKPLENHAYIENSNEIIRKDNISQMKISPVVVSQNLLFDQFKGQIKQFFESV